MTPIFYFLKHFVILEVIYVRNFKKNSVDTEKKFPPIDYSNYKKSLKKKMGVTDDFTELKYIKHKLSAILKRHCYTIAATVTQFFGTISEYSPKGVLYKALYKHLFWRRAQFDWLLTGQDFPVLPTGNTQFLLPCYVRLRREPSFKQSKKEF